MLENNNKDEINIGINRFFHKKKPRFQIPLKISKSYFIHDAVITDFEFYYYSTFAYTTYDKQLINFNIPLSPSYINFLPNLTSIVQ